MSDNTKFTPIEIFGEDERRFATGEVMEKILQTLYFFFNDQEEDLDDDSNMNDFINFLWDIACSSMAVCGMKIIGKTEDGKYLTTFNPYPSVREFLIANDIGQEDDNFFEEDVESNDVSPTFGGHDERLINEE